MKTTLLLALFVISTLSFSQTEKFISHGGITREYLEYVPPMYDGSESVPIVLCLHGLGDTKEGFYNLSAMNLIADTANFIALYPEATEDNVYGMGTAWNSGASYSIYVLNGNIDDVGFLTQIIEDTKQLYNVDANKIFVMGFSMGGFMTNRLACEMSEYFAAGASVAGTQGTALTCNPTSEISMCHIHGTSDATVGYTSNSFGNDAEVLVEYWRNHNQCDITPSVENIPDIASDGKTVEHYIYENGTNNTSVELYKVINGEHVWMYQPVNDISYSFEIWKFFRKQMQTSQNIVKNENLNHINIYPNPAKDHIIIETNKMDNQLFELFNAIGQKLASFEISKTQTNISLSELEKGIYFLKAGKEVQKIIIE